MVIVRVVTRGLDVPRFYVDRLAPAEYAPSAIGSSDRMDDVRNARGRLSVDGTSAPSPELQSNAVHRLLLDGGDHLGLGHARLADRPDNVLRAGVPVLIRDVQHESHASFRADLLNQ